MAIFVSTHADAFTRANAADIDTSTMSDGLGTWSKRAGANPVSIASNEAVGPAGGASYYYDSAATATGTHRVSLTVRTLDGPGPAVRMASGGDCYFLYAKAATSVIYKSVSGALTSLGTGGNFIVGDVASLECDGTTLVAKKNGVAIITVTSETTFSSGRPGFYADNGSHFDDWLYELGVTGDENSDADAVMPFASQFARRAHAATQAAG